MLTTHLLDSQLEVRRDTGYPAYPKLMAATAALIDSNVPDLKLLSKGKVRDIYATSSPDHLLFVASDRISAYDVILKNVNRPPPVP